MQLKTRATGVPGFECSRELNASDSDGWLSNSVLKIIVQLHKLYSELEWRITPNLMLYPKFDSDILLCLKYDLQPELGSGLRSRWRLKVFFWGF